MKKFLWFVLLIVPMLTLAKTFQIPVTCGDVEVPVVIQIGKILDLLPDDFDPDWESLKVVSEGKEILFQIDDVDGNGRISAQDNLVFLAKGKNSIVLSEVADKPKVKTEPFFKVEKETGKLIVTSKDGMLKFEINEKGLVAVTKFAGIEAKMVDEVGIARVSGWPESTFYVDGRLGNHHEETSGAFRTVSLKILEPGPVAVGVVSHLKSERFNGLNQILITYVFKNGDILVDNTFKFDTYADMMKLQTMVTRPIAPAFEDAVHILPVFRRLVWADQLNITPLEYWLERNAIQYVDNRPYIVFPASSSMKPLWWGATYIFASMERFRSNYSPKAKVGIAEILPEIPVVAADYKKWLDSDTWVYESLEFRDGIFKWMPGEFDAYESTKNIYSMKVEDMPNRYKAGDTVRHLRLYSLYTAENIAQAIKWMEQKSASFRVLKIGE
ncbi:hypothetical protein [Pseudothermotoga thermarum]|uniref:EF-hand domain-containing protein n=1 Tax=Pseudothermotoga thermarum DSM 5069 TaxID=688269 RepID=F7YU23_9THEM|nr:hypothetical protein [Pseudothermotoga thermarum]AEH51607.1 hypothetical protein Theth_1554 [Pseudothermotoga thermarum DSM 5069]